MGHGEVLEAQTHSPKIKSQRCGKYYRIKQHRRSQEFVLEGAVFLGGGHSWPMNGSCKLLKQASGRKMETWRNFFC